MDSLTPVAFAQLAILGFVFFMLLNSAAIMVYVERKVAAKIQQRMGPTLSARTACCSRWPTSSSW